MATEMTCKPTAGEFQQQLATLYGTGNSIIWDLYTSAEKEAVENKLNYLIPYFDNTQDINNILDDVTINEKRKTQKINELLTKAQKKNAKIAEHKNTLLNTIWAQRKYCNNDLLMSIVFVLVTSECDNFNLEDVKRQTTFSCHPLFRIRKCKVNSDSENCCMIFVDENARVYQNWSDYINNNLLPKGIMIAPRNGVYTFDDINKVRLVAHKTPASSKSKTALKAVDTSLSVLGLGAAAIPAAALFIPVAAPLLITSVITGVGASLWTIGRSTAHLVDRGIHEQSINITDRDARISWLGIAGGVAGLGASGATQGVVSYAASGREVSKLAQVAVNGMNVTSLTINGMGIGNGVAEIILKLDSGEPISTMDILQLSASLVLFTHSIYNFRLVSKIITNNEGGIRGQFRNVLSESQREIFDKFVARVRSITNGNQNKIDIIRGTGTIPDYTYSNTTDESLIQVVTNIGQQILEGVVRNGRVINPMDLKNCIFHMIEKLSEDVIQMLIEIANDFLEKWSNSLEKRLQRILPFEEVLWKTFYIAKHLFGIQITQKLIRLRSDDIIRKLKETYEANVRSSVTGNIKCDKCRGYYTITNIN